MPKGPRGEKRPADVIGAAVMVARIATSEVEEITGRSSPNRAKGGKAGGKARADSLDPKRRSEIAKKAAAARWKP
jgi:hypothetical protein